MQLLGLWTANQLRVAETLSPSKAFVLDEATRKQILYLASCNTVATSLVNALISGPKVRPDQRKTYVHRWGGGRTGDVYLSVMRAIAMEPRLTIPYAELNERLDALCEKEGPDGASVTRALTSMDQIAKAYAGANNPAIEWDERDQVLVIPDPHLLFYLRSSNILDRSDD